MLPNLCPSVWSSWSQSFCPTSLWPHSLSGWVLVTRLRIFIPGVLSWPLHHLTLTPTWEQQPIPPTSQLGQFSPPDPLKVQLLLQKGLSRHIPNKADLSLRSILQRPLRKLAVSSYPMSVCQAPRGKCDREASLPGLWAPQDKGLISCV